MDDDTPGIRFEEWQLIENGVRIRRIPAVALVTDTGHGERREIRFAEDLVVYDGQEIAPIEEEEAG